MTGDDEEAHEARVDRQRDHAAPFAGITRERFLIQTVAPAFLHQPQVAQGGLMALDLCAQAHAADGLHMFGGR